MTSNVNQETFKQNKSFPDLTANTEEYSFFFEGEFSDYLLSDQNLQSTLKSDAQVSTAEVPDGNIRKTKQDVNKIPQYENPHLAAEVRKHRKLFRESEKDAVRFEIDPEDPFFTAPRYKLAREAYRKLQNE